MIHEVKAFKVLNFGATGVDEILQNVSFIVGSSKYSCPLDRDFGWNPTIDSNINVAIAENSAKILIAIEENEPRVTVEEITVDGEGLDGKIEYKVRVSINE